MPLDQLIAQQNSDGGWPYRRGISWTEPTVYAVLALLSAGETEAARRGIHWLQSLQRHDGGWPPQTGVDESTWVTALVAMTPPELLGADRHRKAITWLAGLTGEESQLVYRTREWLLGHTRPTDQQFPGWPWVPDTAAWVAPTSFAILALRKECRRAPNSRLEQRIDEGRRFLLLRMCAEGGWNHGSVRALGYESNPYPETTGLALAALGGIRSPKIDRALGVARAFLKNCQSADAYNWLRFGLMAHHALAADELPPERWQYRSIPETALAALAAAAQQGRGSALGILS